MRYELVRLAEEVREETMSFVEEYIFQDLGKCRAVHDAAYQLARNSHDFN